jgi:hypothetical protein
MDTGSSSSLARAVFRTGVRFSEHLSLISPIFTAPYIEYLGYFVRTPIGFILLIAIPASLIIIIEIGNIVKEVTKTKEGR